MSDPLDKIIENKGAPDKNIARGGDRFWDQATTRSFTTETGFKAIFSQTQGGTSIAWEGKEVVIALQMIYADGSSEIRNVVIGTIESFTSKRSSPTVTLKIEALEKPMTRHTAERVKDGDQWYENYNLSHVINELMSLVYKDKFGNLQPEKSVPNELLIVPTVDGKLGYWNMGTSPGFDGSTWTPTTASPLTAVGLHSSDPTKIYCGIGGTGTYDHAELWLYESDEDLWTLIGKGDEDQSILHAYTIQKIWHNSYDNKLYLMMWKEISLQSELEDDTGTNYLDWLYADGRIIYWNPNGEAAGVYFETAGYYSEYRFWTGRWMIREMYGNDYRTNPGVKHEGMAVTTSTASHPSFMNEIPNKRDTGMASAGNFTAFKYVNVPFPEGDTRAADHRWRAVHKMGPKPYLNPNDDDVATGYGQSQEFIPGTVNSVTSWAGASGTTQPTGWIKRGNPTAFAVSGSGELTFTAGSQSDGIELQLTNMEDNMTVYRLRLDCGGIGAINWSLSVSNTANPGMNSMPYGPDHRGSTRPYGVFPDDSAPGGVGDHHFSVLKASQIEGYDSSNIYLYLTSNDPAGGTVTANNISLCVARNWGCRWEDLECQAGENIPMTCFSKLGAGVGFRIPPYEADQSYGPSFSLYDDDVSPYTNSAFPPPGHDQDWTYMGEGHGTYVDWRSHEGAFLDFNFIAQDRRLLNGGTFPAYHPMFGPSEAEDGMSPDNFFRYKCFSNPNVGGSTNGWFPGGTGGDQWSHDGVYFDGAPSANYSYTKASGATHPEPGTGLGGFESGQLNMERARSGHGFSSVQVHRLGDRGAGMPPSGGHNDKHNNDVRGIVKYTNGQEGIWCFSQEADNGKGVIFGALNATGTNYDPTNNYPFNWGMKDDTYSDSKYQDNVKRFNIRYTAWKCTNKTKYDFTYGAGIGAGTIPSWIDRTGESIGSHPFWQTVASRTMPLLGTAACTDKAGNVFLAVAESRCLTKRFTGSNYSDIRGKTQIFKIALGTGTLNVGSTPVTKIYDSESDDSRYNTTGMIHGDYAAKNGVDWDAGDIAGSIDHTRFFCSLNWNPYLPDYNLIGWCFRRDNILSDPAVIPAGPCHEVFTWKNSDITAGNNKLTIVDHDSSTATGFDAVAFKAFCFTNGKFGHQSSDLGNAPASWYFRHAKSTTFPESWDTNIGKPVKLNYFYIDEASNPSGGQWWDDSETVIGTKNVYSVEGFVNFATAARVDIGMTSEREVIFAGFSNYLNPELTSEAQRDITLANSSLLWFKIDDREVDPRIRLFDFTGMKVYEAIAQLSYSLDLIMGFDRDQFFMTSRTSTQKTHTLEASKGEIIEIEKRADIDIRNIVTIQPYSPQVQDVEYEITHVGEEEVLTNETLFNGDMIMQVKSHRETTIRLICTRQGRCVADNLVNEDSDLKDASDDPTLRLPPLFKWVAHSSTKSVHLMEELGATGTYLYLNTIYAAGLQILKVGEIVIFTDPETFIQTGRIITVIDTTNNVVQIEEGPGFVVARGTSLTVTTSHIGGLSTGAGNVNVTEYGSIYSDQGIGVVTAVVSTGGTQELAGTAAPAEPPWHDTTNATFMADAFQFSGGTDPINSGMFTQLPSDRLVVGSPGKSYTLTYTIRNASSVLYMNFWFGEWYLNLPATDGDHVHTFISHSAAATAIFGMQGFFLTGGNIELVNPVLEVAGETTLTLNSINAFRGSKLTPIASDYKHCTFLVTTFDSATIADHSTILPEISGVDNRRLAWVKSVDETNTTIALATQSNAWVVGDILNAHYCLAPMKKIIVVDNTDPVNPIYESPPYTSVIQDLPQGLGAWHYVVDWQSDMFNTGDIMSFKFAGIRLIKDAGAMYTGVNATSIRRYGEKAWSFPDNRFIEHHRTQFWVQRYLQNFSSPKLKIKAKIPFDPDITFIVPGGQLLREISIVDRVMFPGFKDFSVSGYLASITLNVKTMTQLIEFRSKEII